MASYNIFNYNYRPAKTIERKLLTELLKEIYGVANNRDLSYVGLGSIFFSDFKLIHKELGISDMVNIEANEEDKRRFEFNKPFKCIELLWGFSYDVLPFLNWNKKKIVWLDYDKSLQTYMFDDIDEFFSHAIQNSFYFVSCSSLLQKYLLNGGPDYNITKFEGDFDGYCPIGIKKEDLTKKNAPDTIRKMFVERIEHNLSARNSVLPRGEKFVFQQLLYITYQDGAPMISLGGILLKEKNVNSFRSRRILSLPYIRKSNEFLDLKSPIITSKEFHLMNNLLPNVQSRFLRLRRIDFIPKPDREKYFSNYRFYPNFTETRD